MQPVGDIEAQGSTSGRGRSGRSGIPAAAQPAPGADQARMLGWLAARTPLEPMCHRQVPGAPQQDPLRSSSGLLHWFIALTHFCGSASVSICKVL